MVAATAAAEEGSTAEAVEDFLEVRARAAADFLEAGAQALVDRTAVHLVVDRIAAADRIAPPRRLTPAAHDLEVTPTVRDPAAIPIDRPPEVPAAPRKSLATANGTPLRRRTLPVHVAE